MFLKPLGVEVRNGIYTKAIKWHPHSKSWHGSDATLCMKTKMHIQKSNASRLQLEKGRSSLQILTNTGLLGIWVLCASQTASVSSYFQGQAREEWEKMQFHSEWHLQFPKEYIPSPCSKRWQKTRNDKKHLMIHFNFRPSHLAFLPPPLTPLLDRFHWQSPSPRSNSKATQFWHEKALAQQLR